MVRSGPDCATIVGEKIFRKGVYSMTQETLNYVVEKTKELMAAPSCSQEAKDAAETKKYIAELEEDIMTLDGLIAFAESEMGAQVFGAEKTKEVAAHGKELKAAGKQYCDCPACAAVEAILAKKDELL